MYFRLWTVQIEINYTLLPFEQNFRLRNFTRKASALIPIEKPKKLLVLEPFFKFLTK